MPELLFTFNERRLQLGVGLHFVNSEVAAGDQHGHVASGRTRYRQIVLNLRQVVVGNFISTRSAPAVGRRGGFDLKQAAVFTHAVDVGEHEGIFLGDVHDIRLGDDVAGRVGVSLTDHGLEHAAPIDSGRRWLLIASSGLVLPEGVRRSPRREAEDGSNIRPSDSAAT